MIRVLYFKDADVRTALFDAVSASKKPLVVTAVRHGPSMKSPALREPFATIDARHGDIVDCVVVADEGTAEGMWRDPLGDLADALFPDDKERAYQAATGYLLLDGGRPKATVKKRSAPLDDVWFLEEALAGFRPDVAKPKPRSRPAPKEGRGPRIEEEETNPRARAVPGAADPWKLLGIAPGTPKDEAKKQFRALITQYHPDKVAHLAPEFRELAERRTREILSAWEALEKSL